MEITHNTMVSDKLKQIKQATGWRQMEIAKKLGVTAKTVSFWINQKTQPSLAQKRKISALFDQVMSPNNMKMEQIIQALEARNDSEINEKNFSEEEKLYYRAKRYVIEAEKSNNSQVLLFLSKGEADGAWYKVGGRSLLFYKYYLAPRLGREVNFQDDTDRCYRFQYGVGSVRWGNRLIEEVKNLGYQAEKIGYDIIVVDLGKTYTRQEIKEFEKLAEAERKKLQKIIKPKLNYPRLIGAINELVRFLPSKIKKLDSTYRGIFAPEMLRPALELEKIYFRMANGHMEKSVAKLEILNRLDDLAATMMVLDENNFLPMAARTRMGENIVNIRERVEEELCESSKI